MSKVKFLHIFLIVCASPLLCFGCGKGQTAGKGESAIERDEAGDSAGTEITETVSEVPKPSAYTPAQQALIEAYPDFIEDIRENRIYFKDGSTMVYDDGKKKDFLTMLDNSDPEDMFFVKYQSKQSPPEYLADAGRSRSEELFKKMYGSSAGEVQKKLVKVPWFGSNVQFTSVNGASEQLKKVAEEIAQHPELKKWMDCSGTFYWRKVRGANRQSAHSYGMAIDIAVKNSDYWLWKNPKASETDKIKYANRIPHEIVEIFEKHGFIWGGAWYHYDTMHFEYRPEIIRYAQLTDEQ